MIAAAMTTNRRRNLTDLKFLLYKGLYSDLTEEPMYSKDEKTWMKNAFTKAAKIGAIAGVATFAYLTIGAGQGALEASLWAGAAAMGAGGMTLLSIGTSPRPQ